MPLCLTTRESLTLEKTVLVLLSVSGGLVELANDEGRSAGDNLHLVHQEKQEGRTVA